MNQETPFASKRAPVAGLALMQQLVSDKVDLQKRLDAAVAENSRLSALCDKWNFDADEMREDNKRLAGELDALKKQKPVAVVLYDEGGAKCIDASMAFFDETPVGSDLYLAAGAQP